MNTNLHKAKKAKNDEFYTRYEDIEKELAHYSKHFRDKIVYCNCDNPEHSNFWKYFVDNFEVLGLKKLIATYYKKNMVTYKSEYFGENMPVIKTELLCDGDFRSQECIDILKESDIIVTNPPFSLFREYVAQLMEYEKKFVILGNMNAVTYKEIFPLIKENKLWAGFGFNKTVEFIMPDDYELKGKAYIDDEGKKHGFVPAIAWYTNLDINKQYKELKLTKNYTPEEYPKYDNYDAIYIKKTNDIPYDYNGIMGVPISWLNYYNKLQFEIIDAREYALHDKQKNKSTMLVKDADSTINGKATYAHILIKRK